MGRWAQARRRGGGGGAPLLPLVTLLNATDLGGGVIELHFDSPVTLAAANVPDPVSLLYDGATTTVNVVAPNTPTTFNIQQDADPSAGGTLTWDSQPPWIVNPVNLTTSVLVV